MANQELVVICLATYKRPNYLSTALQSLMNLNFPENKALHLVVADNDPDETAKDIFQQYSSQLPFGSNYVCEKKRGIASVRNRLVTESIRLGAQYIAFFDDDEEVTSDWLVHAFQVLHEYSAHAVQGSVKYLLPANTKIWVKRGGFLKDKIRQDGEMRKSASTANIIFRVELVDEWNLRFNESFNLSGGSDSLFFQEAYARGAKIVGAKHAVTMEKVPESRVTFKWIMLRRLRNKIVEVRARKIIDGSLKTWLSFFPTTCLSLLLSLMIIPFSILFGRHVFMLCVRLVASCIGTLCGLFNFKYLEYRTIHGN